MGKIDKEKIKEFFQNKRNLKIMIWVISISIILLIIWFFWAIYTQDKPEFVPKETRGDIREGIKENIAKPIENTVPIIGKPLVDAAYDKEETNQTQTTSTNSSSDDTSTWQTYRNEELGYEVKYPEGWVVYKESQEIVDYTSNENVLILQNAEKKYFGTDVPYWGGKKISISKSLISLNNNFENYVSGMFDKTGVTSNKLSNDIGEVIYIIDNGPNRFGGGTGYYYFINPKNTNTVYEIGLDFFMGQATDSSTLKIFKQNFNTFKLQQ